MPFNKKGFVNERFEARTEDVPVPDLAIWFDEGETPLFTVRGLTFEELSRADSAADNTGEMLKLLASLQAKSGEQIAEGVKNAFGIGEETPPNMIRRKQHLMMGAVNPEVDEEFAVKLSCTYPVEFKILTNKIVELTGRGFVPGKQKGSSAPP